MTLEDMELEGTILTAESFRAVEGRVVVEDGEIAAVETATVESDDIVLPAFVNAHTHVGDSIAKEAGRGLPLDDLVAPPDGLKHQLLADADRTEMVAAMRHSLATMAASGIAAFLDFREGGIDGVKALEEAASGLEVDPVIFGRDDPSVLDVADGFGASGARDADFSRERAAAREHDKPFAIHAGERDPEDIDAALDLDPDHLIHMVHAKDEHLDRIEDEAIPVVVCPRSNLVTGVGLPDVERLLDHTTVALGTDNVMLNGPSMFREMEFAAKCCDLDAPTVLRMATRAGATVAGLPGGAIAEGERTALLVLDGSSDNLVGYQDPVRAVVRRAGMADVKRVHVPANS